LTATVTGLRSNSRPARDWRRTGALECGHDLAIGIDDNEDPGGLKLLSAARRAGKLEMHLVRDRRPFLKETGA
jgi:hypothetical protein